MADISGYRAYVLYIAIKIHFESETYDAIKYNFRTNVKPSSYENRRDKFFFEKAAKLHPTEKELVHLYVSNFYREKAWIGDILESKAPYTEWVRYNESAIYNFEKELRLMADTYDVENFYGLWDFKDSSTPLLVDCIVREEIAPETVLFLDHVTGGLSRINRTIEKTGCLGWSSLHFRLLKYKSFVLFPQKERLVSVIQKVFSS